MLHRARDAGHLGHLRGIDPDPDMMAIARTRSDIEWTLGTAADAMEATVSTTLRFLDSAELSSVLTSSGLVVETQFGNWDRAPLDDDSPEIITIATLDPSF